MVTLQGKDIYLRALEPEDLDFIHYIENNEIYWELSATQTPYSKFLIKQYLENAHRDIFDVKQLRLVICHNDEAVLGLIDLFDFNPTHHRAGVGILIADEKDRGKGFGKAALELLTAYCHQHLNLHQLYANISIENKHSQQLFEACGFTKIGRKKDWNYISGEYKDELLYQLILSHVH